MFIKRLIATIFLSESLEYVYMYTNKQTNNEFPESVREFILSPSRGGWKRKALPTHHRVTSSWTSCWLRLAQ